MSADRFQTPENQGRYMWNGIALAAGILLLYLGAEWLIKGAAGLGRSFGIRPLVVGLTIVAYGTSTPELVVSLAAAFKGMGDLALGNVIGSNIANLGLILGVTVVIAPLAVDGALIRREAPAMAATSIAVPLLLADGIVSRAEGLLLLSFAVLLTYLTGRGSGLAQRGRSGHSGAVAESDAEAAGAPPGSSRVRLIGIGLAGLALLIVGGQVFVSGAAGLALAVGLSPRVVGLTVAAVGTSTPELAASIVAAVRRHPSIAVGNVIGSNIFNVVFVLGSVATTHPITGSVRSFGLDLVCLAIMSLFGLILVRSPRVIRRWEGAILILSYALYLYLLLAV